MLMKHSICPSCSVGCGINLINHNEKIVGTYPYKGHHINEGKNCLRGRDSYKLIEENNFSIPLKKKQNKLIESDWNTVINSISEIINSYSKDKIGILSSGKSTNEENEVIKNFAEDNGIEKIGVYTHNFPKIDEEIMISDYDEVNNASFVFIIGNVLLENPLIGRRIVIASDKGTKIFSADYTDKSITSMNSDNYFKFSSISEFLSKFPKEIEDKFHGNSVIIFNKLEAKENYKEIIDIANRNNAKILPILPEANSYGSMNYLTSLDKNELLSMISSIKVLIIIKNDPEDNLLDDEINLELNNLDYMISLNDSFKESMEIFDYIIPIPSWAEKNGSFTNTIGELQNFEKIIDMNKGVFPIEKVFDEISKNWD